jgi:hypothetical protein
MVLLKTDAYTGSTWRHGKGGVHMLNRGQEESAEDDEFSEYGGHTGSLEWMQHQEAYDVLQ